MPRPGMSHHRSGHQADGPRAGDEHILAQYRERKGSMDRIPERVENCGDFERYARVMPPDVTHRQRNVFGKCAGAIYANSLRVSAQVTPPREAIPAAAANHMTFSADNHARVKIVYV